jgi:glycosyltransferase involved in cell wall biosynthesis
MPLFSVIMPVYNRERLVGRSIKSVLAQTFSDWEMIVVDDGSTDWTRNKVQSFSDSRIKLIRQENKGPGAARNLAASLANGKYLAFLDSDDLWMPYTLETYAAALEQAKWPEYLAGTALTFSRDEELQQWPDREPMRIDLFKDALEACADGEVLAGVPMSVISAEAFRCVDGFLEDRLNAEDHDLTLRLGECKGFVAVRAPVTVAYRQAPIVKHQSLFSYLFGKILAKLSPQP